MIKIPDNVATTLKAVFPFFVVIILFVIVGKFGFGKIVEIRDQIKKTQNDQQVLTQKLDVLRNIEATGEKSSNIAVNALPDTNPSLSVISQIKILSGKIGLTVSEIKAGSPGVNSSGLSQVNVSFKVIGPREQVESFVTEISKIAPITIVDKIKISESTPGTSMGNISVKSFWAPFPTKIPAVDKAISDLTSQEQQTLQSLSELTQPIFTDIPAGEGGRNDPFSL
jgi:Tfp pilus assembly protein PilO